MFVLHSVTPGTPDNTYNIRVDKVRDEDQRKDWNNEYTRKSLRGFARKQDMLVGAVQCNLVVCHETFCPPPKLVPGGP